MRCPNCSFIAGHTHTHTDKDKRMHTHTHTLTHTHTHTHTDTHIDTLTHTHPRSHTHTRMHKQIHTWPHSHKHIPFFLPVFFGVFSVLGVFACESKLGAFVYKWDIRLVSMVTIMQEFCGPSATPPPTSR